jgi:hypothetical protein
MTMGANSVTPEQFAELKRRFHGKLTQDEALAMLRAAGDDKALPASSRSSTRN